MTDSAFHVRGRRSRPAVHRIVSRAALDEVLPVASEQSVEPAEADQSVVGRVADDLVGEGRCDDDLDQEIVSGDVAGHRAGWQVDENRSGHWLEADLVSTVVACIPVVASAVEHAVVAGAS